VSSAPAEIEQQFQALIEGVGAALAEYWEQTVLPAARELAGLADLLAQQHPEAREACECLCAKVHPGEHVCDGVAVATVHRWSNATSVEVPVCAPCRDKALAGREVKRWQPR
jgi:hypothetical protein